MITSENKKRTTENRIVPCVVANDLFCFDGTDVLSISQGSAGRYLPEPMEQIVGEIEYQGTELPIISLRALLGEKPASEDAQQYIIVLKTRHGQYGFQVDDVLRAREARSATTLPAVASDPAKPFVCGIANFEDETSDGEETQSALILSTDGLVGDVAPAVPKFLTTPELDLTGLAADTVRKSRQLMLFDLPHRSWNNQVISIGLSVTQVLEVTELSDLMSVPCAPKDVLGLVPWRNQFVPVFDLTHRLSLDSMPAQTRRRIVVARGEDDSLLAFYASANIRSVRLPIDAATIAMENVAGLSCVRGCFATQEGTIVIPSITELTKPFGDSNESNTTESVPHEELAATNA